MRSTYTTGMMLALLLVGCNDGDGPPSSTDRKVADGNETATESKPDPFDAAWKKYAESAEGQETIAQVEALLNASSQRERMIASWPYIVDRAIVSSTVRHGESSIELSMNLADQPTQWSVATASRPSQDGSDGDTLYKSLASFVSDLEFGPIKKIARYWDSNPDDGRTDLLEWKFIESSNDGQQRVELSFRMPPAESADAR